jgi:hypothetical protein
MCSAQTLQGKVAAGPTAEEVRDFILECKAEWRSRVSAGAHVAGDPVFSWDNTSIHKNVRKGQWEQDGITEAQHTLLPPYSPDMHNVIELCHAVITNVLKKEINDAAMGGTEHSATVWCAKLQAAFRASITPDWVQGAMRRMYAVTLPAIIQARGGWPAKSCR